MKPRITILLLAGWIMVRLIAFSAGAGPPTADSSDQAFLFHKTAHQHYLDLKDQIKPINDKATSTLAKLGILYRLYDNITIRGRDRDRDGMVHAYEHNSSIISTDLTDLEKLVRVLEPKVTAADKFLTANNAYHTSSSWTNLETYVSRGEYAIASARMISRPPTLPKLRDTPIEPATASDPWYAKPLKDGVPNELKVKVTSNLTYTDTEVTIEVRLAEGQATLKGDTKQSVTVKPGVDEIVTWEFTPKKAGRIHFQTRIAP